MATILIVDDRLANREFLVTLLGYGGHRLLEAGDGAEALALAKTERPDLVIADVLMPSMDGYEFVRQLRADPTIAATRVLFFTADYLTDDARALARERGVLDVLTKPSEPDVIIRAVEVALNRDVVDHVPMASTDSGFDREHLRLVTDKLSEKVNELEATNQRLTTLLDLVLRLGSERDPGAILRAFAHAARGLVGARVALVGIPNGDGQPFRHFATSGLDGPAVASMGPPTPLTRAIASVVSGGRCIRLVDKDGIIAAGAPAYFPSANTLLAAPVSSPTRIYGWICLLDKRQAPEFSEEDERLVGVFAAIVGRIYENGSLYADLVRQTAELTREIGERRRAEVEARRSWDLLRAVAEGTTDAVFVKDEEGKYLFLNPAAARFVDRRVEDVLGSDDSAYFDAPSAEIIMASERRVMRTGIAETNEETLTAGGVTRTFLATKAPYRNENGDICGTIGVSHDITDRRKLEVQLRQSQKMEAIGRLAGGIAHDFNNLLTVIGGYSAILADSARLEPRDKEMVREVVQAADRAAALTRQLLAFSRKARVAPVSLDLTIVVGNLERMLRRVIGEDIELVIEAESGVGAVVADAGHMEQVVMNLVVNARDAMPRGGRLLIEVRNVELDDAYVKIRPDAKPGPHVVLAVSDDGCGMDSQTMAQIFEPFFTTKGERGTGLGLATVHGIVSQSGGHVTVHSKVGVGTSFKIFLPRSSTPVASPASKRMSAVARGTETVLLTEDDDHVRELAKIILLDRGYSVMEARNGAEAIEVSSRFQNRIDILLTDVVMPGMSGRDLASRLTADRPNMKVLFLSGYTDDSVVHHGLISDAMSFLQKPFTAISLAEKVRRVLDGRASG